MDAAFLGLISVDPDAAAYIAAVEVADGQALESGVRTAMEMLVTELKASPTLWSSLRVFAPLSGGRTLAGGLVPLKAEGGPFVATNLVSGHYDRKFGIAMSDLPFPPGGGGIVFNTPGFDFDGARGFVGYGILVSKNKGIDIPPWYHFLLYDAWPHERGLLSIGNVPPQSLYTGILTNEAGLMIYNLSVFPLPANTHLDNTRISSTECSRIVGTIVTNFGAAYVPQNPARPLSLTSPLGGGYTHMCIYVTAAMSEPGRLALGAAIRKYQVALAAAIP